ncbi:ATP-binding protein [Caminibacter pacificus]|uniref:ATP-binding protein n=1 Tax=Caminibacter pacificus TaxID=1424653 RepID=A0AAJ4RCR1_9BACT|nr:ATP-binding protein [Caminibacter pacificus]QCI27630.1 ATP-binding protein [Caminibacter pacificus]ROR40195.1 putative kinase [Caminibacter pacificus]
MKEITIHFLIGIPASGKSYYAENVLKNKYKNIIHLDSDDIRQELIKKYKIENEKENDKYFEKIDEEVDEIFLKKVEELIKKGENFILDNANYKKSTRDRILKHINEVSKKYNIHSKIIGYYFVVPREVIEKRNILRAKRGNRFLISKESIDYYFKHYDIPTIDEGFDELVEVKINN